MRDFWYTMSGNKNMPDLSVWFDSLIMKEKTYSITATLSFQLICNGQC